MITLNPESADIVKNYFIHEGDRGIIVHVEEKAIESVSFNFLNYITQIEVGNYTMRQRFRPGMYAFIWVQFSEYVRHLFLYDLNVTGSAKSDFFIGKECKISFRENAGIPVW